MVLMLKKHRYELHLVLMSTCQQLKLEMKLTSLQLTKQNKVCSQFHSHLSNLKSPFNQGNTPAPAEVSLVETPRIEMIRHANNMYDNLYHPIDEAMAFNGSPNPNHDPLMPITPSPALTHRNVNFKINDDDESNTPIRNFNFGEKENPYPRFNAGINNIATKKSLCLTTYAPASATSPATYAPAPSAYIQNTSPVTY
jgi:hypothetical protein